MGASTLFMKITYVLARQNVLLALIFQNHAGNTTIVTIVTGEPLKRRKIDGRKSATIILGIILIVIAWNRLIT
jgi:glucose uptake protein GlcU